ncbi:MAG: hypothetical protein ABJE47_00185 [bacterium]
MNPTWLARATAVTLVALAVFAIARVRREPSAPVAATHASVAVLIFDEADSASTGYNTGLAEAIVASTASAGGKHVEVQGPGTTAAFDGNKTPIDTIARALRVTHVLTGTVRRATDGVHVYAQLVRVSDRRHIWTARLKDTLPADGMRADIGEQIGRGAVQAIIAPK